MSDCIGPINIIPDNNQVNLQDNNRSITVVDNNCCTDVNVTQPITSIVQVLTGPAGPPGTQGPVGPSEPFSYVSGTTWSTTSSIEITGSFTVSGSNTFRNIGPAQFTGSVDVLGILTVTDGITGSLYGTSSYAENAATASNILGGKATHVPYFITDTTLATSSIYQSGSATIIINQDNATTANPEALYVWQPNTSSINVISGKGNLNNYLQLNIQNTNQGINASSDVVATANNGSENDNYIDMGINSENFAGFLGGPNDSYLYTHGHNFYIGNINDGYQTFMFNSSSLQPIITLNSDNAEITGSLFGTASWAQNATSANNATSSSYALTASYASNVPATASYAVSSSYAVTASYAANVPATASYAISASHANNADSSSTAVSASHALNADNAINANYASIAGNGGVTQIVAGSGITLLPPTGVGAVTVIASGGGGVTIISGSNVTQSFSNSSTWTFNHNLGTRTPIIEVFDSSYNQIIPQNIQLVDTASATITFPTLESGFAIASLGGVTGNAYSSSYALFSTYADTASYITTSQTASFITASNVYGPYGSNSVISSSYSISSSRAISSSYAASSSYSTSSSYALTASYVPGVITNTGSFATTGSNTFIGTETITGSLNLTGSLNIIGNQTTIGDRILTGSWYVTGSSHLTGNTYLSGSINVSGSQTFVGNNQLIGNTTISGSFTLSGSTTNTIIGNTNVYGEFNVSGSSVFSNSFFTVTGSTYVKGATNISGSTNITGSLNVSDGNINVVSGSGFYRWGNKLFNYAQFAETASLPITANVSGAFQLPITYFNDGISITSGSRITFVNTGLYNIQFSAVVSQGAGKPDFSIWFKQTGSNIANSNTIATLQANSQALLAWNFAYPFNSGSYVEMWYNTTGANTTLTGIAAANGQPAAPTLIVTVTQIA